jgi:hypothetical protein
MYRVKIRFDTETAWRNMRELLDCANVDYEAGMSRDTRFGRYYGRYWYVIKIGKQKKPYVVFDVI